MRTETERNSLWNKLALILGIIATVVTIATGLKSIIGFPEILSIHGIFKTEATSVGPLQKKMVTDTTSLMLARHKLDSTRAVWEKFKVSLAQSKPVLLSDSGNDQDGNVDATDILTSGSPDVQFIQVEMIDTLH